MKKINQIIIKLQIILYLYFIKFVIKELYTGSFILEKISVTDGFSEIIKKNLSDENDELNTLLEVIINDNKNHIEKYFPAYAQFLSMYIMRFTSYKVELSYKK
jgi:hypothetical protein